MRFLLALILLGLATPVVSAQTIGPDVVVNALGPINKWGNFFSTTAYSFSTQSCNIGDTAAAWIETTNQHPVIAGNMYRYKDGRFQQIGLSWLKHGFCALTEPDCGACVPFGFPCEYLGVLCADTYGSTLNGMQEGLGPRSEVNAATGEFPFPFSTQGETGPVLYKRIQVVDGYLEPSLNPSSLYYYEAQYVHPEEAAWGTQYNNVSYRPFIVDGSTPTGFDLSPIGFVVQQLPALYAWQTIDPGVEIQEILVPADGMLMLGARATDLGGGQWHYEYAAYNMNSDRSVGTFAVSLPPGAVASNLTFQDIHYHSGEPYPFNDWVPEIQTNRVIWSTVPFASNPDANALRWGTLYNFGFDCDVAPSTSDITLGLFKPGTPNQMVISGVGPGEAPCITPDFVRGDTNGDGPVDISDAVYLLAYLFQMGAEPVPILDAGDVNADGGEDVSDAIYLLAFLFTMGPEPPFPFPSPGCI